MLPAPIRIPSQARQALTEVALRGWVKATEALYRWLTRKAVAAPQGPGPAPAAPLCKIGGGGGGGEEVVKPRVGPCKGDTSVAYLLQSIDAPT